MNTRYITRFGGLIGVVVVFFSAGCASVQGLYIPYDRPYLGHGYGFQNQGHSRAYSGRTEVYVWGGGRGGTPGVRSEYTLEQLRPQLARATEQFRLHCEYGVPTERRWPRWHCQNVVHEIAYLQKEVAKEERAVGPQCSYTKEQGVENERCQETVYGPWR